MGTRPVVHILLSTARPPYTATDDDDDDDDNGSTTMCHNSTRERVGVGWTCVYMHLARVVSARAFDGGAPLQFCSSNSSNRYSSSNSSNSVGGI